MRRSSKNSRWADMSSMSDRSQACHSLCLPLFPNFNNNMIQTVTLKMEGKFPQKVAAHLPYPTAVWKQEVTPKCPILSSKLHGVTSQYVGIFTTTDVRTSNLTTICSWFTSTRHVIPHTNTSNTKAVGCFVTPQH
jgi:hypothetical protein